MNAMPRALTIEHIDAYRDGVSLHRLAAAYGGTATGRHHRLAPLGIIRHHAETARREVPLEPVQRAFADSGISANALAARLGWTRNPSPTQLRTRPALAGQRIPDPTRVLRAIGLYHCASTKMRGRLRSTSYERALTLITAMGLEPADYGL